MVPPSSTSISRQRSERRIAVHLPLKVRGRDKRGVLFEEDTSSENLCRNGAAFVTRFDVAEHDHFAVSVFRNRHHLPHCGHPAPKETVEALLRHAPLSLLLLVAAALLHVHVALATAALVRDSLPRSNRWSSLSRAVLHPPAIGTRRYGRHRAATHTAIAAAAGGRANGEHEERD
jgi:hypothetical protein